MKTENKELPPSAITLEAKSNSKIAFVFVHGLATSSLDLYHFAKNINEEGHHCELLQLAGHGKDYGSNNSDANMYSWLADIKNCIKELQIKFEKIYLIGFSIGASLSLLTAVDKDIQIDGIVCISTFLQPAKKIQFKVAQIISSIKRDGVNRGYPNTTKKKSLENIWWFKKLPKQYLNSAYETGAITKTEIHNVKCPVLFFHSTADEVADYNILKDSILTYGHKEMKLLSFVELKHFMQLDIQPHAFLQTIKVFFKLNKDKGNNTSTPPPEEVISQYEKLTDESNQWASYCFNLVVGFFSIMGALLYFTLPDVLENNEKAPYYLLSYSIVINIYIQLFSLYYFYNMRTDIYRKNYIEPLFFGISWIEYRTNRWLSNKESEKFTDLIVLSTIALPIISSFLIILFFFLKYYTIKTGIAIQLTSFTCILTFLLGIRSLYLTNRYTAKNLYCNQDALEDIELISSVLMMKKTLCPGKVF